MSGIVADISRSQYLVSLDSRSAMLFLNAKSLLLSDASASWAFAPIDVPGRISCFARRFPDRVIGNRTDALII